MEKEEWCLSQNNCAPLSFYSNFWRTVFAQLRDLSLLFSITNLTLNRCMEKHGSNCRS